MTLAKKLQLRSNTRVRLLNAPQGFRAALGPLPEGAVLSDGEADAVLLFVHDRAELDRLGPEVVRLTVGDRLLWIAYPKRSSGTDTDIHRDAGWETISEAGLRPVRQIAIDAIWSALRFRPAAAVQSTR